jgi:DNA-3-methyladenine glycosylase
MKRLSRKFFERPTLKVTQDLLGRYLVRQIGEEKILAKITETEAYIGENDLASHASRGRTKRTEIMYSEAGHAYIYLVYGMHYMLNIITERKEFPAAALIRGIKINNKLIEGPGKLSKILKIDKKLNDEDLVKSKKLWLENRGVKINKNNIKKSPRVGIPYAKHCKNYLWRFELKF